MVSSFMMNSSVRTFLALTMMGVATRATAEDSGIRRLRRLQLACVTPPTTLPVHIVSEHSGLSLIAKADNNVVQTYASSGGDDNWVFESAGGGLYRVVIEGTSRAMIVEGGAPQNGVLVQVSTGTFTDGRDEWCLLEPEDGIYQLSNSKTGAVVDVAAFSKSAESKIHQWNNVGGINQKWSFTTEVGADSIPAWECAGFAADTSYHILASHSGLAVAVDGDQVGANVIQSPLSSALSDNWGFVPTVGGFYHVIAQHSGLAMAITGNQDGANIIQATPGASLADDWCFIPYGNDIYEIRNRQSSKSLDVAARSLVDGGNVHQWTHYGGGNQKFKVEAAGNTVPTPPAPTPPAPTPPAPTPPAPTPPAPTPPAPTPPAPTPPGPTSNHSSWLGPVETPVIAVAAANLPDGRIVMWASQSRRFFGLDRSTSTWTAIYNPADGSMTEQLVSNTNHDMFCPGTSLLSNGVVMITGGSNSEATTFYDYRNNQWSVGPTLIAPRGYHAHTLLANGDVFTLGGSWSGGGGDRPGEIWSAQSNSWRALNNLSPTRLYTADAQGKYRADNHYWLLLAPNGKVFHAGPSKQMHWITTSGNGSLQDSVLRGDDDDAMNGNAVMYDIGKILTVGGARNYASGPSSNRAYVIDINGSEATVTRTGNMNFARSLVNSVVLPSAEVVVVGGMTSVKLFSDDNRVLEAEIWNPATGTFKSLKQMASPRTYHSVVLLMKDGRVWAAGGGLCGGCPANHQDFEILTPPYLFNNDGSLATRPSIQSAPATARAGDTISVTMDTSGAHTFAMVRASAVTHSVNNDQRRIPLSVISKSGNTFSLQIPANQNVSLTGFYFLFAMNGNGVPSVGEDFRIAL